MNARTDAVIPRTQLSSTTRERWSSRRLFILAAAGSAVGLGNIWKFPYIAGENGGGAFVLVYLICVAAIGLPIMMAETLIGRRGGHNPVLSINRLAQAAGRSPRWQLAGRLGVIGASLVLSFYSVVAGWALAYLAYAVNGTFAVDRLGSAAFEALFDSLLADPVTLVACHTLFIAITVSIVSGGLRAGLERATRWMMPALFALLLMLVAYAAISTDTFGEALRFLFRPSFGELTWHAALVAMGHAFFTLSVGFGVLIAYGSFLPERVSIPSAAITVSILDTVVALLAGLAIFPFVFAFDMQASAGPGLIFVALPAALAQIPGGEVIAPLFFLFLFFAALTSAISLLEPLVEYIEERFGCSRGTATLMAGSGIWTLGIASALAFNVWSEITLFGRNIFEALDYLTANILLPLGGLSIAVFAAWILPTRVTRQELGLSTNAYRIWRVVLRYLTPAGVILVFVSNFLEWL